MQNTQNGLVFLKDNRPITTSRLVAQKFQKEHKSVLRTISNLECSQNFNERNFAPVEYLDVKGEKRPEIHMTRDGFTFLVMGFTGKDAAAFKEEYIAAFNKMYEQLQPKATEKKPSADELLYKKYRDLSDQLDQSKMDMQAKTIKVLDENIEILKETLKKEAIFAKIPLRLEILELKEKIRDQQAALKTINKITEPQAEKSTERKRITFSTSKRITVSDMKK